MMMTGFVSRTSKGSFAFLWWLAHPQLIDKCCLQGLYGDEGTQCLLRQPQLEMMLTALIWNLLAYHSFDGWLLRPSKSEALKVR